MRWLIARSIALIADDGELGTGMLTLLDCALGFDVEAFDALDDCDAEILSND